MMAPKIHILKLLEPHYSAVQAGLKKFEVRKNDQDYQLGDICKFHIYLPDEPYAHGRWMFRSSNEKGLTYKITYILHGGDFGIDKDYVVLGIEEINQD
jgi:hypothetical protein